MNREIIRKDLVILVADKNMEATFKGLLSRSESFGIRTIIYDIFVHPNKDPGCRAESDRFLSSFTSQYSYALVVFDREGCGSIENREALEAKIEQKLENVGWENRSAVIILDPELEIWVWTKSPHVEGALGWRDQDQQLRNWLLEKGLIFDMNGKPIRPKETLELVLKKVRKPRSSAIYYQLAQKVSLVGHHEPAFVKFSQVIQSWFREAD